MVVAAVVLRVATTRPLSDALLDLGEREQNVSVAESSTGGMISANLLSVADRPFFLTWVAVRFIGWLLAVSIWVWLVKR